MRWIPSLLLAIGMVAIGVVIGTQMHRIRALPPSSSGYWTIYVTIALSGAGALAGTLDRWSLREDESFASILVGLYN